MTNCHLQQMLSTLETIQVDLFGPWSFTDKFKLTRKIHAVSMIDPATLWVELHLIDRYGKLSENISLIVD